MKKIVLILVLFSISCKNSNNKEEEIKKYDKISYDNDSWDKSSYNVFARSFTNGTVNIDNSNQLEVLNNDKNYIIGFLSGNDLNKERLILHESSAFIVLGKVEEKQFDNGDFTSIVTYKTKSKLSIIEKVILKYKDPAKCGVFIEIEYYNNKNEIIFKSNGFVRSFC
jgi:hypothetical protein